ncbi:MAG: efflux RND transporter periplasmic adaptor subunit [Anaeromyxobacter sp.]
MTRTQLAAVAAASLALSACAGHGDKATLPAPGEAPARAVRVAKPSARVETGLSKATGTIRSLNEATLAAKGTGQVKAVRVQVGDKVKKGQTLVEMDDAMARIQVANGTAVVKLAEANLANAERDLARAKTLRSEDGMAQASLEKAQTMRDVAAAQLDQAKAGLALAEQNLSDTYIRAPFDGVITARFHAAGDTVSAVPVTPLVGITDVDHLELRLMVPEALAAFANPGTAITGVATLNGQKFGAKVRAKGPSIDPQNRTLEVLADVDPGAGLKPGTIATVDLGAFAVKGDLFLPTSAVRTEGQATYVLVVDGGKAARRDVRSSGVNPGTVAVSGLAPDAQVVLDPGTLAAGDAIVPLAD